MSDVELELVFRPWQKAEHEQRKRFVTRVIHRRAGKSMYSIMELMQAALMTRLDDWRGYYLAPTYKQAKAIAFDMLQRFSRHIPGTDINIAELSVTYFNGSRIELLGAENFNYLRGRYADATVLDECQLIPSMAFDQVISPMLMDRLGWCRFQGTPQGRLNLLFRQYEYGKNSGDDEWRSSLWRWQDTNVLPRKEVERLRRTMSEAAFQQELECSFNAAMIGAFYSKEMARADKEGRLTRVRYEAELPVIVACDLGYSDLFVATFWQQTGTEHRCIECRAYQHSKIADIVNDWRALPFPITHVVLPHDGEVHELATGKTRKEVFESLGCDVTIAPKLGEHEQIEMVRALLPHSWFDREKCQILIEALNGYRSEFDEVRGVSRVTALHSWESHYAKAVAYYATGRPDQMVFHATSNKSSFYRGRAVA